MNKISTQCPNCNEFEMYKLEDFEKDWLGYDMKCDYCGDYFHIHEVIFYQFANILREYLEEQNG